MHLRFGAAAFPEPDRAWLAAAERLPIDSVWHGGHVLPPSHTGEAITRLALMTAWTERVAVGTATLTLPLYHPVMLAKQLGDLDAHSGGRLRIGLGTGGEFRDEFDALGVPLADRASRTDEAIGLMRRLWHGGPVSTKGGHFPVRDAELRLAEPMSGRQPRPGGPPLYVSGRKGAAMRRAAGLGDGWMPYLVSPEGYARSVASITEEAAQAGRSLDNFEWLLFLYCSIRNDGSRAREEVAGFLGSAYGDKPPEMLTRIAPAGTPDEVAPLFQAYVDAGVRHFIVAPATREDTLAVVRLASEEVLPRMVLPPMPA